MLSSGHCYVDFYQSVKVVLISYCTMRAAVDMLTSAMFAADSVHLFTWAGIYWILVLYFIVGKVGYYRNLK